MAKSPLDLSSGKAQNQKFIIEAKIVAPPKLPKNAFTVIVNKDLFRPERTEWKSPTEMAGIGQQVAAPKLILLGVVLCKEFKWAWIQEEGKNPKPKKVSEGANISHWKVAAIEPNAIRLKLGARTANYLLIEPGKTKARKAIPAAKSEKKPAPQIAPPPTGSVLSPPMNKGMKKP